MDQNLEKSKSLNIFHLWTGLTIALLAGGVLIFITDFRGQTAITMLNAFNLALYLVYVLFRKKIDTWFAGLVEQSKQQNYQVHYFFDREIGVLLLLIFLSLGGLFMYFSVFDLKKYEFFMQEDFGIEYASVLLWGIAAGILFLQTIFLLFKKPNKYQVFFNLALTLFFIVCAGEEMSWGQRVFKFPTPDFIKAINVQNETTLHNIGSISVFANAFFLGTLLFFLIIPHLIRRQPAVRDLLYYTRFPVPNQYAIYIFIAALAIWVFLGLRFGTLGFHPFSFYPQDYYTQMDDEFFELFAAFAFFSVCGTWKCHLHAGRKYR